MRTMKRYMILASVALLAACGGDSDDDNGTGPGGNANSAFSLTVGGDAEGTIAGFATHASVSQGESQGFVLALNDTLEAGGVTGSIIIGKSTPGIPANGEHDIVAIDEGQAGDLFMFGGVTDEDGNDWICYSLEGSMNVTQSSASRFKGTVNITAACESDVVEEPITVTLAGPFDSKGGQVSMPAAMVASRLKN